MIDDTKQQADELFERAEQENLGVTVRQLVREVVRLERAVEVLQFQVDACAKGGKYLSEAGIGLEARLHHLEELMGQSKNNN